MFFFATASALAAPASISTRWGVIDYWDMLAFCTAEHVVIAQVGDQEPSYSWRTYWFGPSRQESTVTSIHMKVLGNVRGQAPGTIDLDVPGGRVGSVRTTAAVRPTKFPYPEHGQTFFLAYMLAPAGFETHEQGEIVSLAAIPIGADPQLYGWTMNDILAEATYLEGMHCERFQAL